MTWTYGNSPSTSERDEIRLMVGDTDTTDQLVSDEEIAYSLAMFPKPTGKPAWLAAAATCDAIAGKFARRMQQSIGPLSKAAQQQWEHYLQMAAQFRTDYATDGKGSATGFAGIKAGIPVLGGGGQTYLQGSNSLKSGGTGNVSSG